MVKELIKEILMMMMMMIESRHHSDLANPGYTQKGSKEKGDNTYKSNSVVSQSRTQSCSSKCTRT